MHSISGFPINSNYLVTSFSMRVIQMLLCCYSILFDTHFELRQPNYLLYLFELIYCKYIEFSTRMRDEWGYRFGSKVFIVAASFIQFVEQN